MRPSRRVNAAVLWLEEAAGRCPQLFCDRSVNFYAATTEYLQNEALVRRSGHHAQRFGPARVMITIKLVLRAGVASCSHKRPYLRWI
jgi:hypothetical protein